MKCYPKKPDPTLPHPGLKIDAWRLRFFKGVIFGKENRFTMGIFLKGYGLTSCEKSSKYLFHFFSTFWSERPITIPQNLFFLASTVWHR